MLFMLFKKRYRKIVRDRKILIQELLYKFYIIFTVVLIWRSRERKKRQDYQQSH